MLPRVRENLQLVGSINCRVKCTYFYTLPSSFLESCLVDGGDRCQAEHVKSITSFHWHVGMGAHTKTGVQVHGITLIHLMQ